MPRSRKRYFSEDDFEIGVTPSQLKRTAKTRQLEYLTWWFRRMFEDPANQTPYNSEDGGYQYIWGGPYDARDELGNEFGGVVSDEVIEQVASEVENDGAEWAPGSDHPDHQRAREDFAEAEREEEDETYDLGFDLEEIEGRLDRGVKPQYGDDWERLRRLQILRDIDELQFMLPKDGEHGGMGHNQPPRDSRITDEDTAGVLEAVVVIRSELEKDEPDAKAVVKSAGLLQKILEGLARHLGTAAGEFTKNFGGAAGTAAGTAVGVGIGGGIVAAGAATFGMGDDLMSVLGGVVQSVGLWLQHVTLPF